jgi:Flp pilus assembly protein TadD
VLQSALLAVKQLIAPVPLCLWYDAGILHDPSSADVLVVAAVAFAGLLFGLTAWLRDLRVVWCLMLFGLSLMAVLVRHFLPFPLPSLLGERWLYWPSAFLAVCVGLLIQRMREGAGREMARRTVSVWAAIGLFLAVSAVAAFYTAAQVRAWRDNVALFERAVQSCPPSAYLRSALGKHYFDRQQVAQAREEFMTALSIDPDFPRARIGLGLIDLANNDLQEAFRNFTLARILAPSDANVHNGLGEIYFRTGQYETAIAEFQQAATLRPANAVYFWNLALSLMKVGRYQDAIPAWERVLAASPDSEERETAAEEIRLLKRRLPDGP